MESARRIRWSAPSPSSIATRSEPLGCRQPWPARLPTQDCAGDLHIALGCPWRSTHPTRGLVTHDPSPLGADRDDDATATLSTGRPTSNSEEVLRARLIAHSSHRSKLRKAAARLRACRRVFPCPIACIAGLDTLSHQLPHISAASFQLCRRPFGPFLAPVLWTVAPPAPHQHIVLTADVGRGAVPEGTRTPEGKMRQQEKGTQRKDQIHAREKREGRARRGASNSNESSEQQQKMGGRRFDRRRRRRPRRLVLP